MHDKIEILVHVESIIHSLVSYVDGSVLAQLGSPDMRTPISYALGWPKRISAPSPRLDLATVGTLNFEKTDPLMFPAIELCRQALRECDSAPAVLNAANEVAVAAFLNGKIGFLDIATTVEWTLNKFPKTPIHSLEDIFSIDHEARIIAGNRLSAGPLLG